MNNNLNNNSNSNLNNNKALPDVFKELKEAQRRQVAQELKERQAHKNDKLYKMKESLMDYLIGTRFDGVSLPKIQIKPKNSKRVKKVKLKNIEKEEYDIEDINYVNMYKRDISIHKFNAIGATIGVLFLVSFFAVIKANYSFALSHEEEKSPIGKFEANDNPLDLMEILSENMSEVVKKDISTEEEIISRTVEYVDNNQLPKEEQIVAEEGYDGTKEVTYIRSYENDELTDERIIAEHITLEPAKKVIEVGTSEYLFEKQAHIGDTMYTTEEVYMLKKPEDDAQSICKIYDCIDVTLEEVLDKWCKVTVDGYEGYIPSDKITSSALEPEMVEKSRIKRIMVSLKFDMELNKPSGLKKEDFIKILSNNSQDVNKIFEDNAGLFYELEQEYNVNGVLLASIGIHESGWGTSKIAQDKKNLFGYGAYDSSPYASAYDFETYGEGVELLAKVLSKYYLNEPGTAIYDGETATGSFYNGPTLSGINTRYASDPDWATKVFNKMTMLYEKL